MAQFSIDTLLAALKDQDETNRALATDTLWQIWFNQKGEAGYQLLQRSQALLNEGQLAEAEALLSRTIEDFPDFSEAWNRRAVLYFLQNRYEEALADCKQVIAMVPYHFGALHGLGLCYASLGRYAEAIATFRRALEVQPYATINQRLILECTARMS
jgi:tetratricopeptide (TPR) repeat protein